MQVKLLRVLQEREIQRVGGLKQIPVDLRIIAATNRDLTVELREGRFREDLFYRLNVIHIQIPPLRERLEDLPALCEHILDRLGRRVRRTAIRLSPAAIARLAQYDWPGNVRELENVLERAVVMADADLLQPEDLALEPAPPMGGAMEDDDAPEAAPLAGGEIDYRAARDEFDRAYLRRLVEQAEGNMTRAAQLSGISRRNLYDKIDKLGLSEELQRRR
jgi:DNA-binding NtrC family response regulator